MRCGGIVRIKIMTVFVSDENFVSRTVQYINGWGMDSISSSTIGRQEFWNINKQLIRDTLDLPDGEHLVEQQHVGPGKFDYKWVPTKNSTETLNQLL